LIRADVDGLSTLAAACQAQASALARTGTRAPSSSVQPTPTIAAIAASDADIATAAQRFVRRMQANADKFLSAAAAFSAIERDSSNALVSTGMP